jgi:hypothetical protein
MRPVVSVSAVTWFVRYIYYWKLLFLNNIIINKTTHSGICALSRFWLSGLSPLVLLLPKRLITWLSNLSILSVPDEGYSRNACCALNLISTFLLR